MLTVNDNDIFDVFFPDLFSLGDGLFLSQDLPLAQQTLNSVGWGEPVVNRISTMGWDPMYLYQYGTCMTDSPVAQK
jgi:hypothetical protein